PRRVQPARGHRLPGHDHHRRHGSILGSIYGAGFMTLLPEVLKLSATSMTGVYPNAFGLIASVRDIVFGLAIIFFLMYEPQGLARIWLRFRSYWKLWPYAY